MWVGFAKDVAPKILEYYENTTKIVERNNILDLCCGTGQLALFFLEAGFNVTGIDLSSEMLNYAKKNTEKYIKEGKANFIKANANSFNLNKKVGLVVSTYDALNHLNNIEELTGCFESVYRVLHDNGYFIFDLNTQKGLKNWNGINFMDKDKTVILNRGVFDEENNKAITKVTGFVDNKEGLYERFDEVVFNTVYEIKEVKKVLKKIGMREVCFSKINDLYNLVDNPEEEDRLFVIAKK